jgi:hypothetical protein
MEEALRVASRRLEILMKVFNKFIETIKFYCRGEGHPLRLISIWFFLLNIASLVIGFCISAGVLGAFEAYKNDLTHVYIRLPLEVVVVFITTIGIILGLTITFIYPFIFSYALWKCAFNVKSKILMFFNAFLIIPFIIVHCYISYIYVFGVAVMIVGTLDIFKDIKAVILGVIL